MGIWDTEYTNAENSIDQIECDNLIRINELNKRTRKSTTFLRYLCGLKISLSSFFRSLLSKTNTTSDDVYVFIFLCDFINFFVLLFGFTAFGNDDGDGGLTSYLQENEIPIPFLIMLLLHFVFIVIDRALYLRKFLLGKIIFQILSVIGMHIWLFFFVPLFGEPNISLRSPPVLYYGFKYLYFVFSAYQIGCGYPKRTIGNWLTTGFTMFNLAAFKMLERLNAFCSYRNYVYFKSMTINSISCFISLSVTCRFHLCLNYDH